jgi:hypothetical protein
LGDLQVLAKAGIAVIRFDLFDADQYVRALVALSARKLRNRLIPRGKTMPNKQTSSLAHHVEISYLVRAYGITRDQARRLIGRIGNNRAKLGEAARILKARLPSRTVSKAPYPG